MGRFSENGLKRNQADNKSGAAINSNKVKNQKTSKMVLGAAGNQKTNKMVLEEVGAVPQVGELERQYTEAQMKPVNVGGFRVPMVVRAHWQASAKMQGDKVATLLRAFLIERYGLPEGITEDDLFC